MLDTLKHCLYSQSTKHDERYFSLQDINYKFDQKISITATFQSVIFQEVIPIDKETINDNHEKVIRKEVIRNHQKMKLYLT